MKYRQQKNHFAKSAERVAKPFVALDAAMRGTAQQDAKREIGKLGTEKYVGRPCRVRMEWPDRLCHRLHCN